MDRSSTGATNRSILIEKFNNEKQQLYNQLKELVRRRRRSLRISIDILLDGNSYKNHSGSSCIEKRIRTTRKKLFSTSGKSSVC